MPVPEDKITPVILTAVLGLIAALILQVVIIPLVQRRARNRERWEEAVSDLSSAVGDELPIRVRRFRLAGGLLRAYVGHLDDDAVNQTRLAELIETTRREQKEAEDDLDLLMKRVNRLVVRVWRVRSKSPYWRSIKTEHAKLRLSIILNSTGSVKDEDLRDESKWDGFDHQLVAAAKAFEDHVNVVWDRMSPPSRGLRIRAPAWCREWTAVMVGWLRGFVAFLETRRRRLGEMVKRRIG